MANPFIIMKETEKAYNIRPGSLSEPGKPRIVSEARLVAMYLSKQYTSYDDEVIADHFNRNARSIAYAEEFINRKLTEQDVDVEQKLNSISLALSVNHGYSLKRRIV